MWFLFRRFITKSYGKSAILRIGEYSQSNERNLNVHFPRFLQSMVPDEKIFKSPRASIEIPVISFSDYMFAQFSKFGSRKAMVDDASGTVYTYLQLEDLSRKIGSFLYRKGLRKNDIICYYGTNNPEFCLLLFGCASVGVVLTTANPAYTSGELKRQLEHSGVRTLVTIPPLIAKARETNISDIIVIGNADGCQPFCDMLTDDGKYFPTDITIDPHEDVAIMPYSSGTTGLPKGVMLSHYNVVSNLMQLQNAHSMTKDDANLAVLPFYHIFGMVVTMCGTLKDGGILVTTPGFHPETFLNAILKHKVTHLQIVPPILLFLTRHPLVDKFDLSRLSYIMCGAAPLGEAVTKEFRDKRNITVRQGYGLSETTTVASIDNASITIGSVGPLLANTEAKFVDPKTGKSLSRNTTGELCIRGPQNMLGYLNNEKATNEMIDDKGWLHTGDIGHIEDNDCIVITDRLKELIKFKGHQIAPAELEDVLHNHPAVQDVAVIGIPDDRAGEVPRAYVVLKPDMSHDERDITSFVKQNVSDYKRLRGGVEFVKEIPKSLSGKILRRLLREQMSMSK